MGKIGSKINALAKKASSYGGKLGIIARAVDAVIPDDVQADVKDAKANGNTNEGVSTKSLRSVEPGADAPSGNAPAKKTFKEMWASWGMGVKIGMLAVPVLIIVWVMMKKKPMKRNGYRK